MQNMKLIYESREPVIEIKFQKFQEIHNKIIWRQLQFSMINKNMINEYKYMSPEEKHQINDELRMLEYNNGISKTSRSNL